jgi:Pyridoxamine 5'-phosphate oxidase
VARWSELANDEPELAANAAARLAGGVAYLATTARDGAPRVHPVTPIVGSGSLFVFMEPTSPKGHDLRRDGRFALHSAVNDAQGGGGEFLVRGRARFVEDSDERARAVEVSSYEPADHYVLFELLPDEMLATDYAKGAPRTRRWRAAIRG